ncbi:MAG: DUF1993 domain-containing protein [Proteobacteria bacterium]|nr:MAG: DUF1993 domain-containing protein [Pseudomonadota bacterium]
MPFSIYEATVPVFANGLTSVATWLDKALAEGGNEAALMEARLAPDMRPFSAQIQFASDSAKGAVARLTGQEAPAMVDTERSFAELRERCQRTVEYIQSVPAAAFEGAEEREVIMRFPGGTGYRWTGRDYLTGFALPNFYFHVTTAYALLRTNGVALGKLDYLQHLGMPTEVD